MKEIKSIMMICKILPDDKKDLIGYQFIMSYGHWYYDGTFQMESWAYSRW